MKLRIDEIVVGDRRREDMGDIIGLAESIKQFGLLHPIVVDDQKRLVAGRRRLEACKRLGWEEVPATFLGELTDKQLREIELEENLRRKDLTETEKSRDMVELAKIKKETIVPSDGGFNEARKNLGGRPPKETISEKAVAEAMEVPLQTLRDAKSHVQAVEDYPELAAIPKTHAIEIARQLRAMPEPIRQEKLQQMRNLEEEGQKRNKQIDEIFRIKKVFTDAIYDASLLTIDDHHLSAWLSNMNQAELQRQWELVDEGIEKLTAVREHLKKIFGGPRLVHIGGGK